uniref:Mitochondrial ATPase inhibitor n=1 Tax=Acrobeloides nanus TaxID=290746 RepID=A0A914C1G5_9BILA
MLRILVSKSVFIRSIRLTTGGSGSGSGKGGGSGGAIRDAGGAFGEMESAREEEYFRKKRGEQLEKLRNELEKAEASKQIETVAKLKATISGLQEPEDVIKKFSLQDRIICALLFIVYLQAFRLIFLDRPLIPFVFRNCVILEVGWAEKVRRRKKKKRNTKVIPIMNNPDPGQYDSLYGYTQSPARISTAPDITTLTSFPQTAAQMDYSA